MQSRPSLSLLVLVAIALAALPSSALGETAETTSEPAPAAESPPPSTGWVPQGGASEGAAGGGSGAQQGSSLGSGGASTPAPKPSPGPSEAPAPSAPPPAPEPSTGSYETEAPVETAAPETTIAPAPDPEPAPPPPPPPAPEPPPPADAHVAVGGADALLEGAGGVKGVSASSAGLSQAGATAQVATDSGGLPWLALIVFGLILIVAGARLLFGPFEADSLRYSRFRFLRRAAPRP